ncbi:MAG: hypothetical protein ACAI25_08285, partial [Planctomycetota bacterium]
MTWLFLFSFFQPPLFRRTVGGASTNSASFGGIIGVFSAVRKKGSPITLSFSAQAQRDSQSSL